MGLLDLFRKKEPARPVAERTPLNIQVGDVVSYDGVDYLVKQRLAYYDGGYEWFDYQLVDGDRELWLGAEDDDGLCVAIYQEVEMDLPEPIPDKLTCNEEKFRLDEHGRCGVSVTTESSSRSVQVEYWDYESSGGHYLSVERWGGDMEVSYGKEIKPYELNIFPAK